MDVMVLAIDKTQLDHFLDLVENQDTGLMKKYSKPEGLVMFNQTWNGSQWILNGFVPDFWNLAQQEISKYLEPKSATSGCITMRLNQLEYQMLMLAIMSLSWVCQMRKVKIKEGQCRNETHPHPIGCADASNFHKEFYEYCLSKMQETIDAIKADQPVVLKPKTGTVKWQPWTSFERKQSA